MSDSNNPRRMAGIICTQSTRLWAAVVNTHCWQNETGTVPVFIAANHS